VNSLGRDKLINQISRDTQLCWCSDGHPYNAARRQSNSVSLSQLH